MDLECSSEVDIIWTCLHLEMRIISLLNVPVLSAKIELNLIDDLYFLVESLCFDL